MDENDRCSVILQLLQYLGKDESLFFIVKHHLSSEITTFWLS